MGRPRLSTDRIVELQNSCFADDVPIDFERLRHLSETEARTYFESGGRNLPFDIELRVSGHSARSAGSSVEPPAFVEVERFRVWAKGGAAVLAEPLPTSALVVQLRRGDALLAIGSLCDHAGRRWLKICDPHDGYVDFEAAQCKDAFDDPKMRFQLTRAPDFVLPEPPRDISADTTFTCTFNGRLRALRDAVGSVVRGLDRASLRRIDSWVIIADQGATTAQRLEVQRMMPWATFIAKGAALRRHPVSMNLLGPFVRTRWWLMWEDDWAWPRSAGDNLLARAIDVAETSGIHQVAMNGSWLTRDGAWGVRGAPEQLVQHTPRGTPYVDVVYPQADRQRVLAAAATRDATQQLADGYIANVQPEARRQQLAAKVRRCVASPLGHPLMRKDWTVSDHAIHRVRGHTSTGL